MIFLTVGTQLPFDRLVKCLDQAVENLDVELFGQISKSSYIPKNFNHAKYLSPEKFKEQFDRANIIIAHAGMGTIIESLTKGKNIIVMPRLSSLGEHRNEHQLSTCEKMQGTKGLIVVNNQNELLGALDIALNQKNNNKAHSPHASQELLDYLLKTFNSF